jgi:hypothetical protein
MGLVSLKIQRRKGPMHLHSAVISSLTGIAAVVLLVRSAWPFTQNHAAILAGAAVFLLLVAVSLYRVWKVYRFAYPEAEKGNALLTETLNATMKTHLWANGGFLLLALAVFQFSLFK